VTYLEIKLGRIRNSSDHPDISKPHLSHQCLKLDGTRSQAFCYSTAGAPWDRYIILNQSVIPIESHARVGDLGCS
jgi:hypothetical protein